MTDVTNITIVGVGGQGILLASDVLAHAAAFAGYDVKKTELHGMAQRGGSVSSEVRFGAAIHSPVIPDGETDVLVAFELLEALRSAHCVRAGGSVLADDLRLRPAVRPPGAPAYPDDVAGLLHAAAGRVLILPAARLAAEAGNARAANTVLLGALSGSLDLPPEAWQRALAANLRPALLEVNLRAFESGRKAASRA
jgi:indolepyruvate ferredoxin oxidoreductase beta subunit